MQRLPYHIKHSARHSGPLDPLYRYFFPVFFSQALHQTSRARQLLLSSFSRAEDSRQQRLTPVSFSSLASLEQRLTPVSFSSLASLEQRVSVSRAALHSRYLLQRSFSIAARQLLQSSASLPPSPSFFPPLTNMKKRCCLAGYRPSLEVIFFFTKDCFCSLAYLREWLYRRVCLI